jgi:hypothetical protein
MVLSDLELYYIDLLAGFLSERTFGQQKYYNVDSGGHPRCNKFCKKNNINNKEVEDGWLR